MLAYFKRFGWPVYFWARQVAHFLGGACISIVSHVLTLWLPKVWVIPSVFAILVFVIVHKELREDEHQDFLKTTIDMAAWIFGFGLVVVILI